MALGLAFLLGLRVQRLLQGNQFLFGLLHHELHLDFLQFEGLALGLVCLRESLQSLLLYVLQNQLRIPKVLPALVDLNLNSIRVEPSGVFASERFLLVQGLVFQKGYLV